MEYSRWIGLIFSMFMVTFLIAYIAWAVICLIRLWKT